MRAWTGLIVMTALCLVTGLFIGPYVYIYRVHLADGSQYDVNLAGTCSYERGNVLASCGRYTTGFQSIVNLLDQDTQDTVSGRVCVATRVSGLVYSIVMPTLLLLNVYYKHTESTFGNACLAITALALPLLLTVYEYTCIRAIRSAPATASLSFGPAYALCGIAFFCIAAALVVTTTAPTRLTRRYTSSTINLPEYP